MKTYFTLEDVGEFQYIEQYLKPILGNNSISTSFGSDCSVVSLPTKFAQLVISTDVGPKPISWKLQGGEEDYKTFGYYSVLANISDLASEGAIPIGYTNSTEAPSSFKVKDLNNFFEGVKEALNYYQLKNLGGNLREAPSFSTHGTILGYLDREQRPFGRSGALPGDQLIIVGSSGRAISTYLKAKRLGGLTKLSSIDSEPLLRPRAQSIEMQVLRSMGIEITSASDNSDGVLGAIKNLSDASGYSFALNLQEHLLETLLQHEAYLAGINPWNLYFFWGDWQIVATARGISQETIHEIRARGVRINIIGNVVSERKFEEDFAVANLGGHLRQMNLQRNENFRSGSFNRNVDDHIKGLLSAPIFGTSV